MGERVGLPGRQQLLSMARVQALWERAGRRGISRIEMAGWVVFLLPLRRLLCRFVARAAQSHQHYKSNS